MRQYLFNILLLFAVLTSAIFGSYGSAASAGGQRMILCGAGGERIAMIGMNGTPVPMSHDCGKCCISTAVIGNNFQILPLATTVVLARFHPLPDPFLLLPAQLFSYARGPPVFG